MLGGKHTELQLADGDNRHCDTVGKAAKWA